MYNPTNIYYTHASSCKRKLYLSLVIPIVTYCCQVWRPSLIKDIVALELLLNDFVSDYKTRLLHLKLLPLSYQYELAEITFFISQLRSRTSHFDILDYFSFSSACTRFGTSFRLVHSPYIPLSARHTFFHRFPRLWNSLPPIDLSLSLSSFKVMIKNFFLYKFKLLFNSSNFHSFNTVCPCSTCSVLPVPPLISLGTWTSSKCSFRASLCSLISLVFSLSL